MFDFLRTFLKLNDKMIADTTTAVLVYPQFQKSKNTRLVSHEYLTKKLKKLVFLPSKMGGRLLHRIDLYTGKCSIHADLLKSS